MKNFFGRILSPRLNGILCGCAGALLLLAIPATLIAQPAPMAGPPGGYSGMARIDSETYLTVHDARFSDPSPRLGLVRILESGYTEYAPLSVPDWKDEDGRSNDLESVCALPGRPGEFLAAESGYHKGHFGRIFHLKLKATRVRILRVHKLPAFSGERSRKFEGIVCAPHPGGRISVILGDRGSSKTPPHGLLRWGTLDTDASRIVWSKAGKRGVRVSPPSAWRDLGSIRSISDLYLDPGGTIWASATQDLGKVGPFRSIIYRLGRIRSGPGAPFSLTLSPRPVWTIDGFKVEAISGPPGIGGDHFIAIATDDDHLGGVWRTLSLPPK